MDDLPNEMPYGEDTIILRMTWDNPPRRWARGRWDIARGFPQRHARVAQSPAGGFDADIVPVAGRRGPPGPPPPSPLAPSARPSPLSPDQRSPPSNPLAPRGIDESPPSAGGERPRVGAPSGGASPARPGTRQDAPREQPIPGAPEQKLRLRRVMEWAEMLASGDGQDAHHMVPHGGPGMTGDRDPSEAQDQMQEFGINLDSVDNGAALSRSFHRQVHTERYYDYVREGMRSAQTREGVMDFLSGLRRRLLEGDREFQQTGQMPAWIKEAGQ